MDKKILTEREIEILIKRFSEKSIGGHSSSVFLYTPSEGEVLKDQEIIDAPHHEFGLQDKEISVIEGFEEWVGSAYGEIIMVEGSSVDLKEIFMKYLKTEQEEYQEEVFNCVDSKGNIGSAYINVIPGQFAITNINGHEFATITGGSIVNALKATSTNSSEWTNAVYVSLVRPEVSVENEKYVINQVAPVEEHKGSVRILIYTKEDFAKEYGFVRKNSEGEEERGECWVEEVQEDGTIEWTAKNYVIVRDDI